MTSSRDATPFARRVYDVVARIPKGKTLTYRQVAAAAGSPGAFRAVGNIMSRNRDPKIPCHRVVRSDGTPGAYNGLRGEKKHLLKLEGALVLVLLLVGAKAQAHDGDRVTDPKTFDQRADHLRDTVDDVGVSAAFDQLRTWLKGGDESLKQDCHELTHAIGQEAEKKLGSVSAAFAQGSADCYAGYYHGVLEGAYGTSTAPDVLDAIRGTCDGAKNDHRGYFACLHGLGHAIMGANDHDLPKALTSCSGLATDFERQACSGGVFMENYIGSTDSRPSKYLDPRDPLYPCNAVPQEYQGQCFDIQSEHVLRANGWDFPDAFKTCRRPDADHVRCWEGIGLEAYAKFDGDLAKVETACRDTDRSAETACLVGAGKFMVTYVPNADPREACSSLGWWRRWQCRTSIEQYQRVLVNGAPNPGGILAWFRRTLALL